MRSMKRLAKFALTIALMLTGFVAYGLSPASPTAHAACAPIPGYQTFGYDMARTSYNAAECTVSPLSKPAPAWVRSYAGAASGARDGITTFGSLAYVGVGNDLVAMSTTTGATILTFPTPGSVVGAATTYEGNVFFGSLGMGFYALNLELVPICPPLIFASPISTTPVVFSATRVIFTLEKGDIYAYDPTTCSLVWGYSTGGITISSPTIYGGSVYVSVQVGAAQSSVFVFDAFSGAMQGMTPVVTTGLFTAPVLANNLIYVGTDNPAVSVFAFDAAAPYAPVWGMSLGGPVYGKPAVDGSQVYAVVAGSARLFGLDAFSGAVHWAVSGPASCGQLYKAASPTVANGGVYVGTDGPGCIDAFTMGGASTWTLPTTPGTVAAPVTVVNGWLYATTYGPGVIDSVFAFKA
jgi:outer membrane protein assembly factor BamB